MKKTQTSKIQLFEDSSEEDGPKEIFGNEASGEFKIKKRVKCGAKAGSSSYEGSSQSEGNLLFFFILQRHVCTVIFRRNSPASPHVCYFDPRAS
jgi:hypothetical protein